MAARDLNGNSPSIKEMHHFAAGDLLFREGDPGGDLWIIRSGSVEVFRERNGRSIHLARLSEGELLGTMTVLSGSKRTASVKALTDVRITIVSKDHLTKLVGDMPKWAMTFINDLVARVNYANDLYIEGEHAKTGDLVGPLGLAVQFAESMVSLADLLSFNEGGQELVDLNRCVEKMATFLGRKNELDSILIAFLNNQLLTLVPNQRQVQATSVPSVKNLKSFADVIKDIASRQASQEQLVIPFALGERASLTLLAAFGSGKTTTADGVVSIPLQEVEEALFGVVVADYKSFILNQAHDWGYLKIDKSSDPPSVSFVPERLEFIVKCLEIAISINVGAVKSKSKKKSLIY